MLECEKGELGSGVGMLSLWLKNAYCNTVVAFLFTGYVCKLIFTFCH